MSLFELLRSETEADWHAYTRHEFVRRLGDGSLPLPAFQDYLAQDYRFLLHYARAHALAVFKSRDAEGIARSADALAITISETAMHVGFAGRWGISPAELEAVPEKQGTVAYTRYVIDTGLAGDLLDLEVALAPCAIGYAEIGRELSPLLADAPDHPYAEWITEYASEEFQEGARQVEARLDLLAGGPLGPRRLAELTEVFGTATRLEAAFWQQALV